MRKTTYSLLILFLTWFLYGCGQKPIHHQESFVFGTRVEIIVAGLSDDKARPAVNAVLREFDRLHRTFHAWQPSPLKELNDDIAAGKPHAVTAEMANIIKNAQAFSAAGNYAFDPGIGQLIKLWGFQSDEFKPILPPQSAITNWTKHPHSIKSLSIDNLVIKSSDKSVAIDLGGYLKGYALDQASEILHQHGVQNALINIGGNIMALGTKNGEPWKVGIQHPRQPRPIATLELKDGEAIGTSGDYQRFFELDGKRYCHLLDPRTGYPSSATQALTILINKGENAGTRSDASSKPLFIAGNHWPQSASNLGLTNVLRIDAKGNIEITEAMQQRIHFTDPAPEQIKTIALSASPLPKATNIP